MADPGACMPSEEVPGEEATQGCGERPGSTPAAPHCYRAEDWTDAPAPAGSQYMPGCPVCAYWFAQEQWSVEHPDAPLDFDFDMPDDPWHPELI